MKQANKFCNQAKANVSAALTQPRIVQLTPNLYAVSLEVMKVIPAKYILEQALSEGLINSETLIIESSSGNFALGLAVVCRELGLRLHIVGDPAIDPSLRRMLVNLGADIDIIEKPDRHGAYQRLRLQRVDELLQQNSNAYWVRQYDNPSNPAAYQALASMLIDEFGEEFDLVASVGSGGSSVGLARALRQHSQGIDLTGVDTFNSVLFGLPDGKRTLRGLGNSVLPKILDHTQFDQVHWLGSGQANRAAIELHAKHALFCGPTTGAAYWVAQCHANWRPRRKTLFISPDAGYRYQGTVFNEQWLKANNEYVESMPSTPKRVEYLDQVDARSQWNCIDWNRRSLAAVVRARDPATME
ncbi:MAG: pyridoxal-phosphate dependent enzyme [Alcaligenaceae bacterium]|nr:MAG: pyridoxal-phosphate dependent enzyme [Alcaligenaceae bacterium]